MALPIIADVFRCTLNWLGQDGSSAHNVLHIQSSLLDEDGLWALLDASVLPNCWATASDDAKIETVDILKLDGASSAKSYVAPSASRWLGQEGGQAIMNAPAILKLQTGLRGPRHRGRVFFPYTAEDVQQNGRLNPTTAGLTTVAWEAFTNDLIAGDAALGVASYVHADWNQVTNLGCETVLGTMRRRQDAVRRAAGA